MAFIDEAERDGLRLRELTLEREDRSVTGVLWQHPEAEPGQPLICFGHGASGDRHQEPIPWLARRLVARHRFFALALDGPVHGRRQVGDGDRDAFWAEWKRPGTTEDMTADWIQALDFVQGQPDVGPGPVGYWGLSMGTIYGAPLVAAEARIEVAVLGLMGLTGPGHYRPVIAEAAATIRVPTLFLAQLDDELFSRDDCLALFDALGTGDKRLHASPGGHVEVPLDELRYSGQFLAQHFDHRS